MYDVYKLNRDLRVSELEIGNALYRQLMESGFVQERIVALIYRAGVLDGKAAQRARANAAHNELHKLREIIKQSQPEAIEEGDTTND